MKAENIKNIPLVIKPLTKPERRPHSFLIGSVYWAQQMNEPFATSASISFLESKIKNKGIAVLEKHKETAEIVVIQNGEANILVAKDEDGKPSRTEIYCFNVKKGDAYLIEKNVWHSGFYNTSESNIETLIMFKEGTEKTDCEFFRLDKAVEVTNE